MSIGQSEIYERPAFKAESAEDLRDLITQAELIVANLRGAGPRAQTLLFLLDAIDGLVARLQETGVDQRPEAARIETVERLLLSKDSTLVSQMRSVGGLEAARKAFKPDSGRWWWYLDQRVAERHRQQLRRGLIWLGGIVGVLLVFSLLYRYVFPPDPRQVAVMEKSNLAEQALQQGDLAKATDLYREAAQVMPEDPELQVWIGVLEEKQGHADAANQAYATAEQLYKDQARYLVARGMSRLRLGDLDPALADAQAALVANPESAEATFLLGGVYEAKGMRLEALDAFQKTAELAERANNSSLIVLAKTRMGMLMQSAPMMEPTATGTPTGS